MPPKDDDMRAIAETLEMTRAELAAQAAKIAEEQAKLDALTAQLRMARGTRDMSPGAATAEPRSLHDQVVELLRDHPQDVSGVVAALAAPAAKVRSVMDALRAKGRLNNIGSQTEPRWQYAIGDDGPTDELRSLVRRLISERPFSHKELCVVTGARENRISGALADLREDKTQRVCNLRAEGSKGLWFIIPADVTLAPLRRKRYAKREPK